MDEERLTMSYISLLYKSWMKNRKTCYLAKYWNRPTLKYVCTLPFPFYSQIPRSATRPACVATARPVARCVPTDLPVSRLRQITHGRTRADSVFGCTDRPASTSRLPWRIVDQRPWREVKLALTIGRSALGLVAGVTCPTQSSSCVFVDMGCTSDSMFVVSPVKAVLLAKTTSQYRGLWSGKTGHPCC